MTTPEAQPPKPAALSDTPPPVHRSPIVGLSGLRSLQQEPMLGYPNVRNMRDFVVGAAVDAMEYVEVEGPAGEEEANAYVDRALKVGVEYVTPVISAIEHAKVRGPQDDTLFVPRDALQSPTMFMERPSTATPRPASAEQPTRKLPPVTPPTELFPLKGAFGVIVNGKDSSKQGGSDAPTVIVPKPEPSITARLASTTVKAEAEAPKMPIVTKPEVSQAQPTVALGTSEKSKPTLPKRQPHQSGHGVQKTFGTNITESKPVKAERIALGSDASTVEAATEQTFGSVVSGTIAAIEGVRSAGDKNAPTAEPYTISDGLVEAYLGRESGRRSVAAKRLAGIMETVGVIDVGSAGL